MCGITFLYNPHGDREAVKKFLATWAYQEMRGRDATGILAVTNKGLLYSKAPVPASYFVPAIADYIEKNDLVLYYALGHARAATHGSSLNNANNHPIIHIHDGVLHAIIHNGVVYVSNTCGDHRRTETDSENILCVLENADSIDSAASMLADKIIGSYAVAYMVIDSDLSLKKFWAFKHISPLVYANVNEAKLYASVLKDDIAHGTSISDNTAIDIVNQRAVDIPIRHSFFRTYGGYRLDDYEHYYSDFCRTLYASASSDSYEEVTDCYENYAVLLKKDSCEYITVVDDIGRTLYESFDGTCTKSTKKRLRRRANELIDRIIEKEILRL